MTWTVTGQFTSRHPQLTARSVSLLKAKPGALSTIARLALWGSTLAHQVLQVWRDASSRWAKEEGRREGWSGKEEKGCRCVTALPIGLVSYSASCRLTNRRFLQVACWSPTLKSEACSPKTVRAPPSSIVWHIIMR